MQKIVFNDLAAQYQKLKPEIDAGIARVLEEAHFISGPQVEELEQELCNYTGRKFCVSTSNGTDALLMPLMAWKIGPGDAVFVPAFTFFATAEVVSLLGATPVFCDICEDTFNMDPKSLRMQIERVRKEGKLKPRAVIPVDLFGVPADYPEIEKICSEFGLKCLEDGAQGFGGKIGDKAACSFGDASATSFFPAKALGCYGDGGAVFTDDEELYRLLVSIRVHGKGSFKYENVRIGLNARLDTLQAAILLPKLHAFEEEHKVRSMAAAIYEKNLKGKLALQKIPDGYRSGFGYYTVCAKDSAERSRLMDALKEAGVPTMIYYPTPIHLQMVYSELGYQEGDLPVAESACKRVFSLPMHGYLTAEMAEYICSVINRA